MADFYELLKAEKDFMPRVIQYAENPIHIKEFNIDPNVTLKDDH